MNPRVMMMSWMKAGYELFLLLDLHYFFRIIFNKIIIKFTSNFARYNKKMINFIPDEQLLLLHFKVESRS